MSSGDEPITLKVLSKKAVAPALEKAHQYRVLNEPIDAESICLDVLAVDPGNQQALRLLLLSLTDQFERKFGEKSRQARELLPKLEDDYARAYYAGIIAERSGKTALNQGGPGSGFAVYEWFQQAMEHYERAIELRPTGNDEAILRWNTCARILNRNPDVRPAPDRPVHEMLE